MRATEEALLDEGAQARIAAEPACLIRPSKPSSPLIWEIRDTGIKNDGRGHVGVLPPERNDGAAEALRHMGFVWDVDCWRKRYTDKTPNVGDLIVEAAVRLLAMGLIVRVPRAEFVSRVASGDYTPICTRYVKASSERRRFVLIWPKATDDGLYDVLKRLPGARWNRDLRAMTLPREMYNEMLDFAEANGFQVSGEARQMAAEAEATFKAAVIVDVQSHEPEPPARRRIGEIDAELRDDD